MNKPEVHELLLEAVQPYLARKGSALRADDQEKGLLVYRIVDYLEIEKSTFSLFAYNIRYNLVIDYSGDTCSVLVKDIWLQEFVGDKQEKEDWRSAEYIFIEHSYKKITVSDLEEKIASKLVPYMNKLFSDITYLVGTGR